MNSEIARAVDHAREDVAADGIGAEQESRTCRLLPDRRRQERVAELLARAVRRDDGAKTAISTSRHEDHEADDGALVLARNSARTPPARRRAGGGLGRVRRQLDGRRHPSDRMRGLIRP